jgi:hypothetical protein
MRYMVMLRMAEDVGEPPPTLVEAMDVSMREAFASGWMLDAGGLGPSAAATEVSLRGGTVLAVDGPFSEAKEVVGGYAVLDVRSHEEAVGHAQQLIAIHREYWPGWEGTAEVRRIWGAAELPAP